MNTKNQTEAEQAADLLKLIESMSNQNPAIIQMLTQALSQQQFNSSTAASSTADSAERTINQSGLNVKRSNVNGSRKPSFIELEMPMNLDDKFDSYLISAHSDWDQTFVSKQ